MNQPQEKPRLGVVREEIPEKRLRILVVNDDDVVSSVLRSGFDSLGTLSLKIVPDAEAAIRMLSAEPYDLVAVDPAISSGGFALLKHVKDHYRWTATLLATHDQDPQFLRQAVKCRIDGLLFRPASSTDFIEQALLLAEAVNGRRRRQQKRVLAIGAHPDDVEIGCGGALAKHHADYDILHILTLSRGAAGGDVNARAFEAHPQ
jgi:DNA-binding NtrC family response regulator